MTTRTPRVRTQLSVAVTPLKQAWLNAMGIDVPWIKPEKAASTHNGAPATSHPEAQAQEGLTHERARLEPIQPAQPLQPASLKSVAPAEVPSVRSRIEVLGAAGAAGSSGSPVAIRRDLTGLSLEEIAAEIQQCQQCSLCSARTHAVAGQGVSSPEIMVVGEAPGEQEDREGLPFVGRSGQLLENMLSAIGHDRTRTVFITNVVKCRPPGNRNPKDEEISACQPYLQRQIERLKPKVILAMGRFAAHTLLGTDAALQNLRQQNQSITVQNPDGHEQQNQAIGRVIPVVVTYHPSYLLRRPIDKRLAWEDLKRVRQILL
jgi:uracil-DNA glycosylase family 4